MSEINTMTMQKLLDRLRTPLAFYISAAIAAISMFFKWFSSDVFFGSLSGMNGSCSLFGIRGYTNKLYNLISNLSGESDGLSVLKVVGTTFMLLGIVVILLYVVAIYLRMNGSPQAYLIGTIAGVFSVLTTLLFFLLIGYVQNMIKQNGAQDYISISLTIFPFICLLGGIFSIIATNMNSIVKIVKGEK